MVSPVERLIASLSADLADFERMLRDVQEGIEAGCVPEEDVERLLASLDEEAISNVDVQDAEVSPDGSGMRVYIKPAGVLAEIHAKLQAAA